MNAIDERTYRMMRTYRDRIDRLEDDAARALAREYARTMRLIRRELRPLRETAKVSPQLLRYTYATQIEPAIQRRLSRYTALADRTMEGLSQETARLGAEVTYKAARMAAPDQDSRKVSTAGLFSGGIFTAGREALRKVPGDVASKLRDLVGQAAGMAEEGFGWLMSRVGEALGSAWNTLSRVVRTVAEQMFRRAQQQQRQETPVTAWRRCANHETACLACLMLEGTIYERKEDFGDHPNGRCFLMPMSSANAENDHAGRKWLEEQDEDTQRRIMGKTRWEAWQNGDLSLDDMVDVRMDPEFGPVPHTIPLKDLGLSR